MRTRVTIRCHARRVRPPRAVSVACRRSHRRRSLLIFLLAAIVVVIAAATKSPIDSRRYREALAASGRYVSLPHPATAEMKREAAYLARKYELPLIAESGAASVEIRRFK